MSYNFPDDGGVKVSERDPRDILHKLENEGDWVAGVYLGYTVWFNDLGNPVRAHHFAKPESNSAKFSPEQVAVINGSTRMNFALDDVPKGQITKIRYDGKIKLEKVKNPMKDYTKWTPPGDFDESWPTLHSKAESFLTGPYDSSQQPSRPEKPYPSYNPPPLEEKHQAAPRPQGQTAAGELAAQFGGEVRPDEPPFLTDDEKRRKILAFARTRWGSEKTDEDLGGLVMGATNKALIPQFYDSIMADLHVR